jgi:chorismate-pyruvate lyase
VAEAVVIYREGEYGWDALKDLPPGVRFLFGIDGSLTRALEFLGCGPVSVEILPPPSTEERLVFLCLPDVGPVVQALTRLSPPFSSEDREILSDSRPIGPALSRKRGPLVREGLTILSSRGTGYPGLDLRWEKMVLWSRIYDLVATPSPRLTIREWILPPLVSILEGVKIP